MTARSFSDEESIPSRIRAARTRSNKVGLPPLDGNTTTTVRRGRLVQYGEPMSSSLPTPPLILLFNGSPPNPMVRLCEHRHGRSTDTYLRLYEPLVVHFTSEVLVAINLRNYKTNVAPAQLSYTTLHRINRHTRIRSPNDSPIMERRCGGNITRNCKCLPPRDRRQSSGTLPLTPTSTTRANDRLFQLSSTAHRIIQPTWLYPSSRNLQPQFSKRDE
jgi:hypothetical protein